MNKQLIQDNTKIARVLNIVGTDMDEETVMINVETGKYYGMDPVGGRIWSLLESPKSLAELLDVLCDEYDVEHEQCRVDVLAFLQYLNGEGLVQLD